VAALDLFVWLFVAIKLCCGNVLFALCVHSLAVFVLVRAGAAGCLLLKANNGAAPFERVIFERVMFVISVRNGRA
jgi:hypothetical protein